MNENSDTSSSHRVVEPPNSRRALLIAVALVLAAAVAIALLVTSKSTPSTQASATALPTDPAWQCVNETAGFARMVVLEEENHRVITSFIADMERNDTSTGEKTERVLRQNSAESIPLVRTYNDAKRTCGQFTTECRDYNEMDTDWGGASTFSFNLGLQMTVQVSTRKQFPDQPVIDSRMANIIAKYDKAWSDQSAVAAKIPPALKSCVDAVKASHPSAVR